jgi:hypothetical protein
LRVSLLRRTAQKLNFNSTSIAVPSQGATLDDRVWAALVALEAWFDWDEQVILFDEAESDKSARCTNVPVDVCRRRNEDQTVVGCSGCGAELSKRGVEEGVRNRQACERSSKDDNVERLV